LLCGGIKEKSASKVSLPLREFMRCWTRLFLVDFQDSWQSKRKNKSSGVLEEWTSNNKHQAEEREPVKKEKSRHEDPVAAGCLGWEEDFVFWPQRGTKREQVGNRDESNQRKRKKKREKRQTTLLIG